MEQTDNQDFWRKAQGSLSILNKLKTLRDEVNAKSLT